ncbi:uncharacterized protein LOC128234238 [Mya arenaria]|uniref:uncharacterized protein LOC128234238 n=1 Tax=Mya arenaria TaxID=6604 RepID=UPI0022E59116|nr:uncharacterized protein LOC128234238 [Mya arenaria]
MELILGDIREDELDLVFAYEQELEVDFPTSEHIYPRIPHVVHQTWKDIHVPSEFHANVRSFVELHPDFDYFFWTDASARILIRARHPNLLALFDNIVEPVRRADLLRYVVLYEYGGVYADIDTQCLRPLHRVLNKYACVLSPEPYEHASLIFNTEFMVTNSIMFCRANHPFFKQVLENIADFNHFSQDIDATGPNFLTFQLNVFDKNGGKVLTNKHAKSQLEVKHGSRKKGKVSNKLEPDDDDFIFIPSSQYFQNDLDPVRFDQFRRLCANFINLNNIQKRGCVTLKDRGMKYRQSKYAYTKHFFYHTGYKIIPEGKTSISELVPSVKIYKG